MSAIFRRDWKVTVDTLDVSALDLEFMILSSIKPEPNKCALTVYNLNRDHRQELLKRNAPAAGAKKKAGIPTRIEAGYIDNTSVLFDGDLRDVGGKKDVADRAIVISGDDGGRSYRESTINVTVGVGVPYGEVLRLCCDALGVGLGNSAEFAAQAEIAGLGKTTPAPMTLSGNAAKQLTRVVNSLGLTWSIQHGALQLLRKGVPLDAAALLISPSTGLYGSPEASIDATVSLGNAQQFAPGAKQKVAKPHKPKDPGILKIKTALLPGIGPGRKIDLESDEYSGGYMITEVRWRGQTWSDTWEAECVVRIY